MSAVEVTNGAAINPDVDNSSTNDDNSISSSSSDSDDHSEESGHAPVRSVTTKPRRTEGHQYFKPIRNRSGLLNIACVQKETCLNSLKLCVSPNGY